MTEVKNPLKRVKALVFEDGTEVKTYPHVVEFRTHGEVVEVLVYVPILELPKMMKERRICVTCGKSLDDPEECVNWLVSRLKLDEFEELVAKVAKRIDAMPNNNELRKSLQARGLIRDD